MNPKLKSDIHYFFLELGYKYLSNGLYEKDNVKIEFEDFYDQIFKYYKDDELLYINKDRIDVHDMKTILRDINITNLLE